MAQDLSSNDSGFKPARWLRVLRLRFTGIAFIIDVNKHNEVKLLKPDAWIITGGLNTDVDKLIGNEVSQRLEIKDKNPQPVLGICNWGRLADKKSLLNVIYLLYYACSLNKRQIVK